MKRAHRTTERTGKAWTRAARRQAAALLLFACAGAASAQTNLATGTAYGTNLAALATAPSIASVADGSGSLTIKAPQTTSIHLSHRIDGSIAIDNAFDGFTITGNGSVLSNGTSHAVLSVTGGTNLTIAGGSYIGTPGKSTIGLPPLPGQGSQYLYATNAAFGGYIANVQTVSVSRARFAGASYAANPNRSLGTYGLQIDGSTAWFGDDGSNSTHAVGGAGLSIYSPTNHAYSIGGHGLYANGTPTTIGNGFFSGGQAGDASAGAGYTSYSKGGHGVYVKNAALTILDGTFTGGDAGQAALSTAGAGLYAEDSDLAIEGGTFLGGTSGGARYYGLLSHASSNHASTVALNGGTFNWIGFSGSGTQYLTAGPGIGVTGGLVLDGGLLVATNLDDAAFQSTIVNQGSLLFSQDFALGQDGYFVLASPHSSIEVPFGSLSFLSGSTNYVAAGLDGSGLFSAETITFQTNSTLSIVADLQGLPVNSSTTSTVASASLGINIIAAGGSTNAANEANFTQNVNIVGGSSGRTGLAGVLFEGNDLRLRFTTLSLGDYWGADGQLALLADELDAISNATMLAAIDAIDDPAISAALVEQTYFTTFNTFQTALQGMRAAVGQSISRGTEFREQLKLKPEGAQGPERNNALRGWGKYYGQFLTHDAVGLNPEYDTILQGGVVGVDTSFGNLMLGIGGGGARYYTRLDSKARENTTAFHGNLYGTYGMERGYLDAGLAYGRNQVENRTAEPFLLEGEFDAQVASAYLGGGYDLIDTKGGTVFTPEASIQYSHYVQEEYTETGTGAVPRHFDEYDADSLLGSVGMNVSMLDTTRMETFGFKLEGRIHWMHEFMPDPDRKTFTLEGGNTIYPIAYPHLDEEIYRLGIGCSFFNTLRQKPKNVILRLDFDELFGDGFNSHNVSAKLVYAF